MLLKNNQILRIEINVTTQTKPHFENTIKPMIATLPIIKSLIFIKLLQVVVNTGIFQK